MEKKYRFTGNQMTFEGHVLREIFYIRDVSHVCEGAIGGWIEGEHNLSHEGDCLVLEEAKVFGHAHIMNNAVVGEYAIIKDNAQIRDNVLVYGESVVGADTIVSGESKIFGKSHIYFFSNPFEINKNETHISGHSIIQDCKIEATGRIINSDLEDIVLDGTVDLIDKNNKTSGVGINVENIVTKFNEINYGNEMSYFDINTIFKR